ncbi:hypothetical protein S40288_03030 [Stachybotrys chartarum IBT 40288]|nr:hypothetical protein S40288_03030 [Stachybotrys chartarum IBT 40288]
MASASTTDQLPSAAVRQSAFEQAVAYSLHLWPALTLSVQNGWGGPDSEDKRDWFAGAIVDLFPEYTDAPPAAATGKAGNAPPQEPDTEEVETVLLQVMVDEFEVNVDDESGMEVAAQIVRARTQCAVGQFDEVNALKERFQNRKGKKVDQLFKKADDPDQETDEESSGDDSDSDAGVDVDMDDAPPLAPVTKEKPLPEVDEDGFTKVTKKKR